jgi:hypothetical protein
MATIVTIATMASRVTTTVVATAPISASAVQRPTGLLNPKDVFVQVGPSKGISINNTTKIPSFDRESASDWPPEGATAC